MYYQLQMPEVMHPLPIEEILLDGSSSTDSDGEIVSYSWVVLSGPTGYGLSNSESAQSSLTVGYLENT
ncbi:PKD domain-containing protein [Reichenbachiella ulvae]|uniref:PKD domain-containing protein n=1 Tax=Reichenbachiella ulvae TaxID=2980104 RepID=A0ABT3D0K1_9BACT|nr:PKD domain-containing protein [Reichenbachiella ulvae]MCV9389487.1 PKD domain-containing protein [Reichenbachiella ulvae]